MVPNNAALAQTRPNGDAPDAPATIGQQWAASTRALIADRDLTDERRRFFEALAGFADRTGCVAVIDHEVDLWGYGTIKVGFADNDGNWWTPLLNLIEPTGLSFADLRALYWTDVEEGRDDVEELSWLVDDPGPDEDRNICMLEYVGPSFAMHAMLAGPWQNEFSDSLMPTFRRAAAATGLDSLIGQGAPVATYGQARESAFRGPAGAL